MDAHAPVRWDDLSDKRRKELEKTGVTKELFDGESASKPTAAVADKKTQKKSPSLFPYVQIGARLQPIECLFLYLCPLILLSSPLGPFIKTNSMLQLALFLPVVSLPAFFKERMSYVDIGWPLGLVLLSASAFYLGTGYWLRRYVVCLLVGLHGSRMGLGALVLFYPYDFPKDLPRYQYARVRWEVQDGMPASMWWFKIQHDTLQQAFANAVVLATPISLCAFDQHPEISPLEVIAWVAYVCSWLLESAADIQKQAFIAKCKADAKTANDEEKARIKSAVLGHPPYDTPYPLWTRSRHPNYFFEWMCWNSFNLAAIPSLLRLDCELWVRVGLALVMIGLSRFFYDCLMYWTGALPAEHSSVQKRPDFKDYQERVNVFFPFDMPGVDHYRVRGWPVASEKKNE